MRVELLSLVLLVSGCKKRVPEPVVFDADQAVDLDAAYQESSGTRPVTSGAWEGEGLSLYVPPGWSGSAGPGARVLHIEQAGTGFTFTVHAGDGPGARGEDCHFESDGAFRAVPVLGTAQTRTCAGGGRIRQVWWGEGLVVESSWPMGSAILGRQAITPLLEGLRRTGDSGTLR
ncbi:MAG: hypothetical protein KC656_36205, partial [Myxococcales bacterium]|nr:hypothetical protein [Myxococcales bacterium]